MTPARCCPARAAAPERARANPAGHRRCAEKGAVECMALPPVPAEARPVHARSSCGIKTAARCLQAIARATAKDKVSDAPRPCTPTAATSSARVHSVSDDDAQNWRCRWAGSPKFGARNQKIVASRLCDLRASTSAVRQADRLRGAAHPVVNIRTSEHHISRARS